MATRDDKARPPPEKTGDATATLPLDQPAPAFALPKRPPSLAERPPDDEARTETGEAVPAPSSPRPALTALSASDLDPAASTAVGVPAFQEAKPAALPKVDPTATVLSEPPGTQQPANKDGMWESQSLPRRPTKGFAKAESLPKGPVPAKPPPPAESTRILDLDEVHQGADEGPSTDEEAKPLPPGAFSRQQARADGEVRSSDRDPGPRVITEPLPLLGHLAPEQRRAVVLGVGAGLVLVLALVVGMSFKDLPSEQELFLAYPYGSSGMVGPRGERAPPATEAVYKFLEDVECFNYDKCVRYSYSGPNFSGTMVLGKGKNKQWERFSDEGLPFRARTQ